MLKSYLKTAWRNLTHNKVYSALNIVGLGAGMAIALYFLRGWLLKYDYRISIGPAVFALAALAALAITLATISFQAIRAATSNPVGSLRTE